MRSVYLATLISILAFTVLAPPVDAEDEQPQLGAATDPAVSHASDHVLVKLETDTAPADLLGKHQSVTGRWVEVAVPEGRNPSQTVAELATLEGVELVELDYVIQLDPVVGDPLGSSGDEGGTIAFTPNDEFYPLQWHMPKIQAEQAWDISDGDDIVVAVIDTGVSQGGEDLDCHTFVSPLDATTDTPGSAPDDHNHGTHVSGTVAQCTNNAVGVSGVAHGARLMPVKVCDADGDCAWSDVAQGIDWARTHGADVINLSLGGGFGASILQEAVSRAVAADILIVAASGNDATGSIDFPAAYPGVLAVGALDFNLNLAYYSQYGTDQDLTAPGGDITTDRNGDGFVDGVLQETFDGLDWAYHFFQGTSMATPHVAGAAALLRSEVPSASRSQVEGALIGSALDRGAPGWDSFYGHGALRARSALDYLTAPPVWPNGAEITAESVTATSMVLQWPVATENQGIRHYRVYQDGQPIGTTGSGNRRLEVTGLEPDTAHRFAVRAVDNLGYQSSLLENTLATIGLPPTWSADAELVVEDITSTSLVLTWPKARSDEGVTEYRVYRDDELLTSQEPTRRSLAVTGLAPATTYEFEVRAFDGDRGSAPLATSATTLVDACSEPRFADVPCDHLFLNDVTWLADERITVGCNPPANNLFCPDDSVTRAQMAAFLTRGLHLPPSTEDTFTDDDTTVFEADIQALAAAGITHGCNPPANNHFCPDDPVSRAQMAAFLTRGLHLPPSTEDTFTDDDTTVFEADIQALAAAGITHGCNPPANNDFCPDDPVSRAQMAAFLRRGLEE